MISKRSVHVQLIFLTDLMNSMFKSHELLLIQSQQQRKKNPTKRNIEAEKKSFLSIFLRLPLRRAAYSIWPTAVCLLFPFLSAHIYITHF